jgi:hypothetical protein
MLKLVNVLSFILIFTIELDAQFSDVSNGGASFISLANSGTALDGVSSIYFNQAGITSIDNFAIDLSAEKRFELNAFASIGISIVKKTSLGHFGLTLQKFGLEEYSQQKIGFVYARKLIEKVKVAAQFNYNNINIDEYGNTSLYNFEIGILSALSREISLGVHVVSPISKEINDGSKLQSEFAVGIKYQPSNKVMLLADIAKTIDFDPEFRLGLIYDVSDILQGRIGYNVSIGNIGFGFGVNINKYAVRGGYSINNILGNTPSMSLQYQD